MSRKFLTPIDLAKNELQNAVIQQLASDPSSPVQGQIYYNTTDDNVYVYDGSGWVDLTAGIGGGGDASTNTSSSVDSEVVLFSGTGGKTLKRATTTGMAKLTSGVLSAGTAGTDYTTPSSTESFTNKTFNANGTGNSITNIETADFATNVVDTDGTLAANSSTRIPAQSAVKTYVDSMAQGLKVKTPVRVATTANGTLATAFENGDTVDGVTLATGDRILIKDQSTAADRGIYTVNASGAPTRATDADASGEIGLGTCVWVQEGTTNGGQIWCVTAVGATPWVPGSSSSTWTQFSGASATTAGAGLTATGNVFAVGAGTGIVANADNVTVDRSTNGATVPFKYTATIGDNSSTSIAVTHNLGTKEVIAQARQASDDAIVECDIVNTSTTQTTFSFAVAPASSAIKVVILG